MTFKLGALAAILALATSVYSKAEAGGAAIKTFDDDDMGLDLDQVDEYALKTEEIPA